MEHLVKEVVRSSHSSTSKLEVELLIIVVVVMMIIVNFLSDVRQLIKEKTLPHAIDAMG